MTKHSSTLTSVLPLLWMVMVGLLFTALAVLLYKLLLSKRCMGEDETAIPESPDETTMAFNGIEDKVLESIPILAYSGKDMFRSEQNECVVCLNGLEEGAMVRLLPICRHAFHLRCINQWFFTHSNCPLCRTPVISPSQAQADHQDLASVDVAVVQKRTSGWLQPWNSYRFPTQRQPILPPVLKKSLSMDSSYVTVEIRGENILHRHPQKERDSGETIHINENRSRS